MSVALIKSKYIAHIMMQPFSFSYKRQSNGRVEFNNWLGEMFAYSCKFQKNDLIPTNSIEF